MGERAIFASDFRLRKCAEREHPLEDQISQLPNEILASVLSFLKLKEAARTSVLSKRWVDLWMYVTRLDFDASEVLRKMLQQGNGAKFASFRERERRRYVDWVNKVLHSHKSLALDDFRVAFDLDKFSGNEIDKWLQYAFARRVQRLELDLSECGELSVALSKSYNFPYGSLGLSGEKSSEKSQLTGYCDIHPCALIDFKALRTLSLKSLKVNGEALEIFLRKCPFLERLLVHDSSDLINLEVCGPSLGLKYLDICHCLRLESFIVRNTNLVSLKTTEAHCLVLQNVPMLVDVWVSGWSNLVRDVISWLSCCLSKLEFLTLCAAELDVSQEKGKLHELPQLTSLKQFTLVAYASKDDSLIGYTSLIRASPNLEKFVLKLEWWWANDRGSDMVRRDRKFKKAVSFPLQHLKVVELLGYYGRTSELELVEYFLENAVVLGKIIIDPRDQRISNFRKTRKEIKQEKDAEFYAKQQLEGLIPSHIEFVIL